MVIVLQLLLALIIGIVTSGFYAGYSQPAPTGAFVFDGTAALAFCIATVLTVVALQVVRARPPRAATNSASRPRSSRGSGSGSGSGRETGKVKWFNYSKGFGFITRDSGDDVFVHYRGIRGSGRRGLREGQHVEFDVREGDKGLQADDVVVLE